MEIQQIQDTIELQYCKDTEEKLTDESLQTEYLKCQSVKNQVTELISIMKKTLTKEQIRPIIIEYLPKLIPPGTKGVIRGKMFNFIVKDHLENMSLDADRFELAFEKKSIHHETDEIPDWYVYDRLSNKIIIGMNQIDLWSGGHQINRGSKYIHRSNTENIKLVCVVCNHTIIKGKNKTYNLFNAGFTNKTLCYLKGLNSIINEFF